jgi:gliding motility-associated-like protein
VKRIIYITFCSFVFSLITFGQSSNPAPYCNGGYTSGNCNQPGPSNSPSNSINDFIDIFTTSGANVNINNSGSGCNGNPNNFANYCQHYLSVNPGQVITCTLQSGIIYSQGFAIWVDWNQDNTFNLTNEFVAWSAGVPTAATPTVLTFTVPSSQANGVYRLRVRCAYNTPGNSITPCGTFGFGETEDYTLYIGPIPPSTGPPTGTATVNSPVCSGTALNFSLATTYSSSLSFTWNGPANYSSTAQSPTITNPTVTATGIYTVIISNTTCPTTATVQVIVVDPPNYNITPSTFSICQGGIFAPGVTLLSGSSNQFSYFWSSTSPGQIFNPQNQLTTIQPSLLPVSTASANYVYSVIVSPTIHLCPVTKSMVLTIFNPRTPTITLPPPFCDTHAAIQMSATPGGGTWSANPAVTSNGLLNPPTCAIGTNTLVYTYNLWNCTATNSASFVVSRYNSPALSSTVSTQCVQDPAFNLMNIVQNTVTGSWSGTQVNNNFFNPSGLPTGNYGLTYHTTSLPIATVCPASTVLVVSVFNPPTPIINAITPVCNTSGTVALVATPANGIWSGNSGVSPTGVQTPSLNQIGVNTVTYTAGQGTCVASSARSFTVSQFNTAAFTGTISALCANNNPVSLMTIVQNTNGVWSGINVGNNFFTPSNLTTNTYSLVYTTTSTPNPQLCPDSRVLVVSVLSLTTPIIKQVGPYCSTSAAIQLSVSPATGSWSPSAFLTAGGLYTPSLTAIGGNQVQYVVGTPTCNAKQTITINTELFVPATIFGTLPDLCTNTPPATLAQLTANNLGSWYGPGIVGSTFNPSLTGGGTFIVSYNTASSPSGLCPDQNTLVVHVYSLAPPQIDLAGPFCNKSLPQQLVVTPVGGFFNSGTPGLISTSGLFNPAAAVIGDNMVTYSVAVGPCIGYSRLNITVEGFVSADFDINTKSVFCKNEPPFNLNSIVQNPGGTWSGAGVIGNMFYPSQANVGENNIVVYQTQSASSLCQDTSAIRIKIKDIPNVTAVSNIESGCAPVKVLLNTPTINTGKGLWTFGDGTTESGLTISHTYTQPGSYIIQFDYSDQEAEGCKAQFAFNKPIVVYEVPKADFIVSSDEVTISNPEVMLTNISSPLNNNSYIWTIQGMNQVFDLHPQITFPQIGNYEITLQAISVHGCMSQVSKSIEVKNDFNIYIPNSFSPNADGLNDYFKPVFSPFGLDQKTYDMEVFDRWGSSVFHTKDFSKGWDGSVQNKGDLPIKQDSYIYKIRFKDTEGRVYEKMGSFILLPN